MTEVIELKDATRALNSKYEAIAKCLPLVRGANEEIREFLVSHGFSNEEASKAIASHFTSNAYVIAMANSKDHSQRVSLSGEPADQEILRWEKIPYFELIEERKLEGSLSRSGRNGYAYYTKNKMKKLLRKRKKASVLYFLNYDRTAIIASAGVEAFEYIASQASRTQLPEPSEGMIMMCKEARERYDRLTKSEKRTFVNNTIEKHTAACMEIITGMTQEQLASRLLEVKKLL